VTADFQHHCWLGARLISYLRAPGKLTCFLCLAAFAVPVHAADFVSQHLLEVLLEPASKVEWTVLTRVRAQQNSTDLYQARLGTYADFAVHPRFSLTAGYLFTEEEEDSSQWESDHRLYGGVTVPLTQALETRGRVERFLGSGTGYTRYRQRFLYELRTRLQPYVSAEAFLDAHGLHTTRWGVGIQPKVIQSLEVDFGYIFDDRKTSLGGQRHFITSSFTWQPASTSR
jgi:hypothetical protein